MKRILFLSHYALPHLGGIEVVVDALARELVRCGYEVAHIASGARRSGESAYMNEPPPYEIYRVRASNVLETHAHVPWPLFGPGLFPLLLREVARADIVHAHGMLYTSSVAGLLAALGARVTRVLTEHVGHVSYSNRFLDRLESVAISTLGRLTTRCADGIVVLNEKVRSEIATLAPATRLVCIPNGVDTSRYRPAHPGERERLRRDLGWDSLPRVLFVGRLVQKKGLDLAIAAMDRLRGRARLAVVGPGRADPVPGVEMLGPQSPSRVAELYRAADVFLLPSRGEGFPLTAQEAMASGLPAVLADDAAYGPYLDGEGGRAVAATAEALAGAVEILLDPGVRLRAAEAAVNKARRSFSWKVAAEDHLRLYHELWARRRRGITAGSGQEG